MSMLKTLIMVAALFSAFKLGQQQERPKAKWPGGTLMQGGWEKWRPVQMGIVAVAIAMQLFQGGGFPGFGGGQYM